MKFVVKNFFILISSIIPFVSGFSQTDTIFKQKINQIYLKSYFIDAKDILISPLKWDTKESITAGIILGSTALLYTQDKNIQDIFQKNRTNTLDNISKYGLEPWGSGLYSIPTLGIFYTIGELSEDQRLKNPALSGIKAYILSGAFTMLFKYTLHRHRPDEDNPSNPYIWEGPLLNFKGDYLIRGKYTSFPSGHTSTIFAVATVVATEYRDYKAVPIICYTIASLSGISRIYDNRHWASDVLFGAALGFGIGKLVAHKYRGTIY